MMSVGARLGGLGGGPSHRVARSPPGGRVRRRHPHPESRNGLTLPNAPRRTTAASRTGATSSQRGVVVVAVSGGGEAADEVGDHVEGDAVVVDVVVVAGAAAPRGVGVGVGRVHAGDGVDEEDGRRAAPEVAPDDGVVSRDAPVEVVARVVGQGEMLDGPAGRRGADAGRGDPRDLGPAARGGGDGREARRDAAARASRSAAGGSERACMSVLKTTIVSRVRRASACARKRASVSPGSCVR